MKICVLLPSETTNPIFRRKEVTNLRIHLCRENSVKDLLSLNGNPSSVAAMLLNSLAFYRRLE